MNELEFYRAICTVACERDFDTLLGRSLDAAMELSGAGGGHLVLPQPAGAFAIHLSRGEAGEPAVSEGILSRVFAERRALRLENALESAEFQNLESVKRFHILSVLAVPVIHGATIVAVIYLVSTELKGIFSQESEDAIVDFSARIGNALSASIEARQLRRAGDEMSARLALLGSAGSIGIVGASPTVLEVLRQVAQVAPTDVPVLVTGESGTGKELIAHAIHSASLRKAGPWMPINCGAIPETLLESELFGHERGAFTGATARAGKIAAANGGTLFLDEVSELSPQCQVRLLRALQSGEIQRLGSDAVHHVDVRVVAACNRPLAELVRKKEFREDLYYRLAAVTLELPPLRRRGEDVVLLAEHFLRRHGPVMKKASCRFAPSTLDVLRSYPFPGNVRELENVVRRALVFVRDELIGPEDLPPELRVGSREVPEVDAPQTRLELQEAKRAAAAQVEQAFARSLLTRAGGNVAEAARLADMNRSSLHELIRKHGIEPHRFR